MSAPGKTIFKPEHNEKMTVSIRSALDESAQTLARNGVDDARGEANLLLSHVLQRERVFLFAHPEHALTPDEIERLRSLIARRAAGEPLQYLTGVQQFFKLDFEVNTDVLIPRPETELIVAAALEVFGDRRGLRFADIGTGSGCIAISLLHELPNARGVAVDVLKKALEVAQRNAERHGVSDRLQLIESDGLAAIETSPSFDLIVSNPPYVSDEEMKTLQREVRREPAAALAGGPDGLVVIRSLLCSVPDFLQTDGYFIFEIGFAQDEAAKQLIDQQVWELIEIRRDFANIPRTVVLQKK